MTDLDLDAIEAAYCGRLKRANWQAYIFSDVRWLVAEVRRLRAIEDAARKLRAEPLTADNVGMAKVEALDDALDVTPGCLFAKHHQGDCGDRLTKEADRG